MLKAVAQVLACVLAIVWSSCAFAGVLNRETIETFFPAPFLIGEKDEKLPVWPIFKQNATSDELIAYVFESADLAPIPGFSGSPIDLMIALAPDGTFLDVKVLAQHEPVFVDGLGPEPLFDFVKQYAGKSLKQSIGVGPPAGGAHGDAAVAIVDGVAKATASVRILNESLLTAGLVVARAKLGFAEGRDPSRAARVRSDAYEKLSWSELVARGYVKRLIVTNRQQEDAFKGTDVEGLDPEARANPDATFVDLYLTELDLPIVGKNLLDKTVYDRLIADLDGRHALLALSTGRLSFMDDDFTPGAAPRRLVLSQSGAPVEMRDFAWRKPFLLADMPAGDVSVLVIKPQAGWDPASEARFSIRATRQKGQIYPELVSRDFDLKFSVPTELLILPAQAAAKGALGVWRDRGLDLGVIGLALGVLSVALLAQRKLVASSARLLWFRRAFLLFTLVFIGWRAQAQLSIVTLIGAVRALHGEGSLGFLLYDPPSLLIWGFTLASLVVWGRGAFCGWLCPFGALQEFSGDIARALRIKQIKVGRVIDARLRGIKYLALASILICAYAYSPFAERLAEIEPFKTAITLSFVRSAPFVIYAGGLIFGSMFVYKFFCRYLCPLGAAFAILGRLRRWDWIPRRIECGSPCQLCKAKCRYDAIRPNGSIVYHECFQCLDCVAVHDDARQCVPLVLQARGRRGLVSEKVAAQ